MSKYQTGNCRITTGIANIKTRRQLKIMSWNIQDQSGDQTNKFEVTSFTDLLVGTDIICLQETKGMVKLPDYIAYNSNRPKSRSGGVAVLVHQSIKNGIRHIKIDETYDAAAIKLDKHYFKLIEDIYIVTFYLIFIKKLNYF